MRFRPIVALILLAGALLLSGCVTFDLINLSELNIRVMVHTPDSSRGVTKFLRPAGVDGTFSEFGGSYRIAILPDEEYRQLLLDLQSQITTRLFEEGAALSASDVANLTARVSEIDRALEDLARPLPFCAGQAPDWSNVQAIVNYNTTINDYVIECTVTVSED